MTNSHHQKLLKQRLTDIMVKSLENSPNRDQEREVISKAIDEFTKDNKVSMIDFINWKKIDHDKIRPSQTMIMWSKKGFYQITHVDLSKDDPRGELMDQDGNLLDWDDFIYFCEIIDPNLYF